MLKNLKNGWSIFFFIHKNYKIVWCLNSSKIDVFYKKWLVFRNLNRIKIIIVSPEKIVLCQKINHGHVINNAHDRATRRSSDFSIQLNYQQSKQFKTYTNQNTVEKYNMWIETRKSHVNILWEKCNNKYWWSYPTAQFLGNYC